MLHTGSPHVLSIEYHWQGKTLVAIHNFSDKKQKVTIPGKETLQDLYSHHLFAPADGRVNISLDGYGFVWVRK